MSFTQSTLLNANTVFLTEHFFVKVPLEEIRRSIKFIQKLIERDFTLIYSFFANKSSSNTDEQSKLEPIIKKGIETSKKRLSALYEKISSEFLIMERSFEQLQKRLEILERAASGSIPISSWNEFKIQRFVNDYLQRNNYMQTSQMMLERNGQLGIFSNTELFKIINTIEHSLLVEHSTATCLNWVNENRLFLKKLNSDLEFLLRTQEYIELARMRKIKECITFAKKHLIPFISTNTAELQRIMGLLAISVESNIAEYKELYSMNRWNEIAKLFRSEIFSLYGLSQQSPLISHIQAGLSSIKTFSCLASHPSASNECPVCSYPFNTVAMNLPFSHHENSRIVCRITGCLVDDNNPPAILPNGHVYSFKGLKQIEKDGVVTCPMTGEVFEVERIKKCYFTS